MPDDRGNIFLTLENLAFAMPLIALCGIYVILKFVPWQYTVTLIVSGVLIISLRSQLQARKEQKLQNLDEDAIRDIVGDEVDDGKNAKNPSKIDKQRNKVKSRLAQEAKKGKSTNVVDDDDVDDDDIAKFAKGSRTTTKKTK